MCHPFKINLFLTSFAYLRTDLLKLFLPEFVKVVNKAETWKTNNCFLYCCQAFNSLGEAAYDAGQVSEDEEEPQTYALSPWFQQIVWKLLEVTDRYEMIKQLYVKNERCECSHDTTGKMT